MTLHACYDSLNMLNVFSDFLMIVKESLEALNDYQVRYVQS